MWLGVYQNRSQGGTVPCPHTWAPEASQSADFLPSKHMKAWKNITPLLLETEPKGKAPRLDPGFRHRNPGAVLAHKVNFPLFLGALAADILLTFRFLNSVYAVSLQRPLPDGNPCCSSLRCYCLQLPALSLSSKLRPCKRQQKGLCTQLHLLPFTVLHIKAFNSCCGP